MPPRTLAPTAGQASLPRAGSLAQAVQRLMRACRRIHTPVMTMRGMKTTCMSKTNVSSPRIGAQTKTPTGHPSSRCVHRDAVRVVLFSSLSLAFSVPLPRRFRRCESGVAVLSATGPAYSYSRPGEVWPVLDHHAVLVSLAGPRRHFFSGGVEVPEPGHQRPVERGLHRLDVRLDGLTAPGLGGIHPGAALHGRERPGVDAHDAVRRISPERVPPGLDPVDGRVDAEAGRVPGESRAGGKRPVEARSLCPAARWARRRRRCAAATVPRWGRRRRACCHIHSPVMVTAGMMTACMKRTKVSSPRAGV